MKLQRLTLYHEDDKGDLKNLQLFVTEDCRILVEGLCRKCGMKVSRFFPLTELYTMCPAADRPQAETAGASRVQFTVKDRRELQAMHITLPDGD